MQSNIHISIYIYMYKLRAWDGRQVKVPCPELRKAMKHYIYIYMHSI